MMAIAQHHGRPRTRTDRAWYRELRRPQARMAPPREITDPELLDTELARIADRLQRSRICEAIGYVEPTTNIGVTEVAPILEARLQGLQSSPLTLASSATADHLLYP